jgi:hypothetical protein
MSMRSGMRIGLRNRAGIRTVALAGGTAALLLAVPAAGSAATSAQPSVTSHFVFVPTTAEVSSDSAYMNNGATDGRPGALVFVQENATPGGVCGCSDLEEAIGVWYSSALREWAVFNENQSAMPASNWYNVLVVPKASKSAFVQRAAARSTAGDHTFISSKLTYDNPKAIIQVTQVWNPGGSATGVYNADTVGVAYYKSKKQWAIFNEDKTRMPVGTPRSTAIPTTSPSSRRTTTPAVKAAPTTTRASLTTSRSGTWARGRTCSTTRRRPRCARRSIC